MRSTRIVPSFEGLPHRRGAGTLLVAGIWLVVLAGFVGTLAAGPTAPAWPAWHAPADVASFPCPPTCTPPAG